METTDIEKKSLEAHVELCAERYKGLESKLEAVEENVVSLKTMLIDVKKMVQDMASKRNDQLISWGGGTIMVLIGIIGWLITKYILV